jgi:RNA recognition motif-containing protein
MVKSLHQSLEAKLASIEDPEYDSGSEPETNEPETISKRGKSSNKRKTKDATLTKITSDDDSHKASSVIYLGHLPTAFEERELIIFLNQFGSVNRCRVSRSTKTGRSRGYAFVEFYDEEVARIVAETMNGYFLLEKRLVCHVLPRDKVYDLMFKRPKKVISKKDVQNKVRLEVNKRRAPEVMKGITAKLVQREEEKRKKLAELGINYDFPGYAAGARAVATTDEKKDKSNKRRKVSMDEKENNVDKEENKPIKTPKSSKKKAAKAKVNIDENENSADKSQNDVVMKTPKASKKKIKAMTEVKKDKKKKDKKRKSLD